jgi:hypothetical protein
MRIDNVRGKEEEEDLITSTRSMGSRSTALLREGLCGVAYPPHTGQASSAVPGTYWAGPKQALRSLHVLPIRPET